MKVYQEFLGERQRAFVSPAAIPFDVQSHVGDDAREYELLKTICSARSGDPDPWGLISWKFQHKSLVSVDEFLAFCRSQLAFGFDCVFVNPMIGNEAIYHDVWEQGIDQGHQGLDRIHAFLGGRSARRLSVPMGRNSFAFCNYFVARPRFWADYFTFVDDAMAALAAEGAKNSEVGRIYRQPANYARDASVSMRPFVIERLFSSFIAGSASFRCAGFEYPPGHFQRKFGERLGTFLENLSELKNNALEANDERMLQDWHRRRSALLRDRFRAVVWQLDDPPLLLAAGSRATSATPSPGGVR